MEDTCIWDLNTSEPKWHARCGYTRPAKRPLEGAEHRLRPGIEECPGCGKLIEVDTADGFYVDKIRR